MPRHGMMVGIRAWNRQVPLPQPYAGSNAFRFPLRPRFAEKPVSAKESLFRGAIAVAANGVPIFNPIKQDGRTDTYLAGELDEFGGHAGRADDYHYHLAPVHLAKLIGPDLPAAWALDGFPIFGYREPGGAEARGPDWLNGHSGRAPPTATTRLGSTRGSTAASGARSSCATEPSRSSPGPGGAAVHEAASRSRDHWLRTHGQRKLPVGIRLARTAALGRLRAARRRRRAIRLHGWRGPAAYRDLRRTQAASEWRQSDRWAEPAGPRPETRLGAPEPGSAIPVARSVNGRGERVSALAPVQRLRPRARMRSRLWLSRSATTGNRLRTSRRSDGSACRSYSW